MLSTSLGNPPCPVCLASISSRRWGGRPAWGWGPCAMGLTCCLSLPYVHCHPEQGSLHVKERTVFFCASASVQVKRFYVSGHLCQSFSTLHTTGYVLQSSRLLPWEAPIVQLQKSMKFSYFFLSTFCAQQGRWRPGCVALLPIANSIMQMPFSDTA